MHTNLVIHSFLSLPIKLRPPGTIDSRHIGLGQIVGQAVNLGPIVGAGLLSDYGGGVVVVVVVGYSWLPGDSYLLACSSSNNEVESTCPTSTPTKRWACVYNAVYPNTHLPTSHRVLNTPPGGGVLIGQ